MTSTSPPVSPEGGSGRTDRARTALACFGLDPVSPPPARGAYVPMQVTGTVGWVSGVTGRRADGPGPIGAVGDTLTVDDARHAARRAAANLLAAIADTVGLDALDGLGHLRGYVRAVPDFARHPEIVDAASDVLVAALGTELGRHARTALGVASLPGGAVVELDLSVHVRPGPVDDGALVGAPATDRSDDA